MLKLKQAVARAALDYIEEGEILGLGTGSTVDCLIELLPEVKERITGVVSSSERTSSQIRDLAIPLLDLNEVSHFPIYIDGADEIDPSLAMIKGGGGALTREKIVAAHAERFICIADMSKQVAQLGAFPLPIEVIPMAAQYVMRQMKALGGVPRIRPNFVTDNGNLIVDVQGLSITDPVTLEREINQITGVVTNGLFAQAPADLLLVAHDDGEIETIQRSK